MVILVNGNFSEFVLHLAAGSDKGIKKGAGESFRYFWIFAVRTFRYFWIFSAKTFA